MSFAFASVVETTDLTRRLRRIVLEVPDIAQLGLPDVADAAVGVYFPSVSSSGERVAPPAMEFRDGVWAYHDAAPEGRNYSVRHRNGNRLTLDVHLHERGVGAWWARTTAPGDRVVLSHARSWYRPPADVDWQLLVADLAGLPAAARIIDELPSDLPATAIVEVGADDDLTYLPTRPNVRIVASVGTGNGRSRSRLAELVREHRLPAGRCYCWFAGEAAESRSVRKYFRTTHRWTIDQFDIIGYWRFDSETWDARFELVADDVLAVYEQALADGKGDKIASEELDEALERAGL
jgi:NADPH-dependent ferric siderophore reductase